MDKEHYNELIVLSQQMYDRATDQMTDYFDRKYGDAPDDAARTQLEDYLFVAEETSAYLLGNALALLSADSQEAEIRTFVENLHGVIEFAVKQRGDGQKPS